MANFIGVRRCTLRAGVSAQAFERDLEALTSYFLRCEPGLQHFSWSRRGSERTTPDYLTLEIWVDADAHGASGKRRMAWARGEGTPTAEFLAMYPALERIRDATDNAPVEWFQQPETAS